MTERYVAYLAGIGERDITRLGAQCGFWERVTRQVDRLSNRISAESQACRERITRKSAMSGRLQYDQWHSEGTRLLGSDRVTPPVSKPQSGRQTVNVLVATGAESRSDEAVGTKIITDAEVSFGAKPNIIKSGP
jgi:hypothetical protein